MRWSGPEAVRSARAVEGRPYPVPPSRAVVVGVEATPPRTEKELRRARRARVVAEEDQALAIGLRAKGMTWARAGEVMGCSDQTARAYAVAGGVRTVAEARAWVAARTEAA